MSCGKSLAVMITLGALMSVATGDEARRQDNNISIEVREFLGSGPTVPYTRSGMLHVRYVRSDVLVASASVGLGTGGICDLDIQRLFPQLDKSPVEGSLEISFDASERYNAEGSLIVALPVLYSQRQVMVVRRPPQKTLTVDVRYSDGRHFEDTVVLWREGESVSIARKVPENGRTAFDLLMGRRYSLRFASPQIQGGVRRDKPA